MTTQSECVVCGGDCGQCGGPVTKASPYGSHPDQTSPMTVERERYLDEPRMLNCGCLQFQDHIDAVMGCTEHGGPPAWKRTFPKPHEWL